MPEEPFHHASPKQPLIAPPERSPSPRRPRGALHHAASEEPIIIPSPEEPFSIAPRHPGGAAHHATRFSLQPLIAEPRRSLHCTAPEEPFYRASPEEFIIIFATEQPLIALHRRSPSSPRPGGALHHNARLFLEPFRAPARGSLSACPPSPLGALCRVAWLLLAVFVGPLRWGAYIHRLSIVERVRYCTVVCFVCCVVYCITFCILLYVLICSY